jgi:hypothetical protein
MHREGCTSVSFEVRLMRVPWKTEADGLHTAGTKCTKLFPKDHKIGTDTLQFEKSAIGHSPF